MSPSPHSPPPPREHNDATPFWRLSRRTWLRVGAAFAIGLLLFVLLWSSKRNNDFFRVAPAPGPGTGSEYEPLPAPLAADGSGNASAAPGAERDEATETPRIVESAPVPQPAATEPASAPPPVAAAAPAAGAAPVPIDMPAPRYPASAARRGLEGKVRVRVDVGADGVPTEVAIAEGSGIRDLDRAALDAVRRWRFRPGQVDGRPVAGSVVVPIEFDARD